MYVQGSTATTGATYAPSTVQTNRGPVLPEPADANLNDALVMLLTLLSKSNQTNLAGSKSDIDTATKERNQRLLEAQAAYKKMKEAENDPFAWVGQFFKAIVAAASALATVATGGAAAPALTASAMAFGGVVKETQCFGDLSNIIGTATSLVGSLGTGSLAAITGDGLSLTAAVGTETKAFDADVALGLQIAGSGVGTLAAYQAKPNGGDSTMATLATEAGVAGNIGAVISDIRTVVRQGEAAGAALDVKAARNAMARLQQLIETLIESVEDLHNSHNKAVKAVEGALETQTQTAVAVVTALRA